MLSEEVEVASADAKDNYKKIVKKGCKSDIEDENLAENNNDESNNQSSFISLEEEVKVKANMKTGYLNANYKNKNPNSEVNSNSKTITRIDRINFINKSNSQNISLPQKVLTKYPKFIEISFSNFAVQFIDFNSGAIVCIKEEDEEKYNNCNRFAA